MAQTLESLSNKALSLSLSLPDLEQVSLFAAITKGHAELVKALVYSGADPDKELDGLSPLCAAILNGKAQVVEVLLGKGGANPLAMSQDGTCALVTATIVSGQFPEGPDILRKVQVACGQLGLLLAQSGTGDITAVRRLLGQGINPNHHIAYATRVPLVEAAAEGHTACVNALIAAGCNVNVIVGKSKPTSALVMASARGHLPTVDTLLKHGAVVDYVSDPRHTACTALSWAVLYKRVEVVKRLLQAGADPNYQAQHGDTPLHLAVERGSVELIVILLKHGANPELASRSGYSPRRLALARGKSRVIKAIAAASEALPHRA